MPSVPLPLGLATGAISRRHVPHYAHRAVNKGGRSLWSQTGDEAARASAETTGGRTGGRADGGIVTVAAAAAAAAVAAGAPGYFPCTVDNYTHSTLLSDTSLVHTARTQLNRTRVLNAIVSE